MLVKRMPEFLYLLFTIGLSVIGLIDIYIRLKIKDQLKQKSMTSFPDRVNARPGFSQLHDDVITRDCLTGKVIANLSSMSSRDYDDKEESMAINSGDTNDLSSSVREYEFTRIFQERVWGAGGDVTNAGFVASGGGSTLNYAQEVIAILHTLVAGLKVTLNKKKISILDVPCGDMQWMSRFLQTRDDVIYTGLDIVPELINRHREVFSGKPWRFRHHDAVKSPINESYDLVISRHVLQHLAYSDIFRFLSHVSDSNSSYLLVSTFPGTNTSMDISAGEFRHVNLQIPPTSLRPPLCLHKDGPTAPGGYQGLWTLPLRRKSKCSRSSVKSIKWDNLVAYAC